MDPNVTPRGEHRVLYVSDPSTVAKTHLPDPATEADIRRWIDLVADSGVDLFDQEIWSQGWTAWWRSENYQYDQRRQHRRFRDLLDAGTQPLDIVIDQCRQHGMKIIGGFRMNDGHAYSSARAGTRNRRIHHGTSAIPAHRLPGGRALHANRAPRLHVSGGAGLYARRDRGGGGAICHQRCGALLPGLRIFPSGHSVGSCFTDDRSDPSDPDQPGRPR